MKSIPVRDAPVGMIGLGIMGSAMSANLMRAGFSVTGYDVLARRRREHQRAGGDAATSAGEVGRAAGVVVCSLPSADALLSSAAELAGSARPKQIVVETST